MAKYEKIENYISVEEANNEAHKMVRSLMMTPDKANRLMAAEMSKTLKINHLNLVNDLTAEFLKLFKKHFHYIGISYTPPAKRRQIPKKDYRATGLKYQTFTHFENQEYTFVELTQKFKKKHNIDKTEVLITRLTPGLYRNINNKFYKLKSTSMS